MITKSAYDNAIKNLTGFGLDRTEAETAGKTALYQRFKTIEENAGPAGSRETLRTAHDFVRAQIGASAVAKILDEIQPGLSTQVHQRLAQSFETIASTAADPKDVARAYENVKSILDDPTVRTAAAKALKAHGLTVTEVAYNDASRTHGVWGDRIADVRYEVFEPTPRQRHVAHGGVQKSTFAAPIVKDSNWEGPFAVADLAGLSVTSRDGKVVSLADVIRDPSAYVNGWNGPDGSFWSEGMDRAKGATLEGLAGPKISVQDNLIPVADGHTETVPSIYTYGSPTLVLIAVPGEGISAHYTDGNQKIRLPIHQDGKEKALRITREQFSAKKGPTSFSSPGENVSDGQLINSAIIVQIPVEDPTRPPRRMRGMTLGGAESTGAKSFSLGRTRGAARGLRPFDAGRLGTEAGVVTAGAEIGDQRPIPAQIRRQENRPIVVTYSLYAATDSNVVGEGLAARMRHDIDAVREHPAFKAQGVENP